MLLKVGLPQFLYFSSFSCVYEEAVLHLTPWWGFYLECQEWCLFLYLAFFPGGWTFESQTSQWSKHQICDVWYVINHLGYASVVQSSWRWFIYQQWSLRHTLSLTYKSYWLPYHIHYYSYCHKLYKRPRLTAIPQSLVSLTFPDFLSFFSLPL